MRTQIKKWAVCLLAAVIALTVILVLPPQRAEAAGASLSGSGSLRAGDSVTLTFSVSGSGIVALQGSLSYDSDKLEFLGMDQLIGGSWGVELSGSTIIADDSRLTDPIDGSASILAVTFRVKSGVESGSTVSASISGVSASDGNSDFSLGSAYWEAGITAPLSSNAKLSALSCSNATLSPAFSSGTTYYSTSVPYDVTSLSLSYDTDDDSAGAYVSGNELDVGSNTVTITVEAEDGTTKYYTIEVTREQDPEYEASKDADLSKLTISSGRLSPAFSPDVTDYVVYVPFEKKSFSVDGYANDSKALGVDGQKAKLAEGENVLTVVCTAEDGTTTKTYTVHVYRMPAYNGVLPTIIAPDAPEAPTPDPTPEPEPVPAAALTLPTELHLPVIGAVSIYVVAVIVLLILLALFLLLGLLLGRSAAKKKLRNAPLAPEEKADAKPAPDTEEGTPVMKEQTQEQPDVAETADELEETQPVEEQPSAPQEPIPAPQGEVIDTKDIDIEKILNDIRNM